MVTGRSTPQLNPGAPGASREAPPWPKPAVAGALRALPVRQREALVLIFYGGLTEAQAASAMGIRPRMARNHLGQAVETLRAVLGAER